MADAEDDAPALEAGRRLFAGPCTFMQGVVGLDHLPEADLPEVAFAGRSNVGKSSLLNTLTGRNALARTSNTPGRTQELNFFDLGGRLILVDLPGYGYAEAPKIKVKAWQALLRAYLRGRATLRRTCLLVDARHGLKELDRELMRQLTEAAVVFQIVLTKTDLVKAADLERLVGTIGDEVAKSPAAFPEIAVTSSRKGGGIELLRANLAMLARSVQEA